jgi:hypothetical protein
MTRTCRETLLNGDMMFFASRLQNNQAYAHQMFSIVGCGIRWAIETAQELSVEFPKDSATALLTIWLNNSAQACKQLNSTSGDANSCADTLAHGAFPDYAPLPWLELFETMIAADDCGEELCDLYVRNQNDWIDHTDDPTDWDQDEPGEVKISTMQTYMRKARGREGGKKGGKVRGHKGTGKSKSGVNRKSGSGGHNKSTGPFLCKSCGTTKPRGCYATNQWKDRIEAMALLARHVNQSANKVALYMLYGSEAVHISGTILQ